MFNLKKEKKDALFCSGSLSTLVSSSAEMAQLQMKYRRYFSGFPMKGLVDAVRKGRFDALEIYISQSKGKSLFNFLFWEAIDSDKINVQYFCSKILFRNPFDFPTMMRHTISHGNLTAAEILFKVGAKPNMIKRDRDPVIINAVQTKNMEMIDLFLKYGGKLNTRDLDN